jgi:magnesium transporter
MPIVDGLNRLVGRVTIDDVVDFIKDEANEDYQKLSGLSENVESRDGVWLMTRARLPWLVVGLVGGLLSSLVIGTFEGEITKHVALAFFMPLVMAMGGNAGVQSSAIVVQGLANNTMQSGQVMKKLGKEFMVALINGLVCSLLVLLYGLVTGLNQRIGFVVSISLLAAIVIASIVGALIPLLLDKYKIDPALATGPFITTSNDLLGLFVYFYIGYLML